MAEAESHAAAGFFGGEEAIEQAAEIFGLDGWYRCLRSCSAEWRDRGRLVRMAIRGSALAVPRDRLHGIDREIDDHLLKSARGRLAPLGAPTTA